MSDYRIGQVLRANRDIELEDVLGTKKKVKKGSKIWIGADKFAHHLDGTIQPLATNMKVEGYDTGGMSDRIFLQLKSRFPIDVICEDYEIEIDDIKDEIAYALEEIGF